VQAGAVPILGGLAMRGDRAAVIFGDETLTYSQLAEMAGGLTAELTGVRRVAVLADASIETCIACVATVGAGMAAIPISPGAGERELAHIVRDSGPDVLLAGEASEIPSALTALPRISPRAVTAGELQDSFDGEQTAFILYTSGTTGLPKGVLIPRRAIASNLDAIAGAWAWTERDRVVHGLPLFHVHGLLIGVLGVLRRGGTLEHVGRFSPGAIGEALDRGGTLMFGVPTMYHRLAEAAEADPSLVAALRRARLLVSGSAPLPTVVHERLARLTGQRIVERYGMTETLMNCAMRAEGSRTPGYVGPAVDGVDVRLVDDDGRVIEVDDDETFGELHVRGENLFTGYLNRPDATAEAMDGTWFKTGDIATRAANGDYRIVGRRSTDLIKSGGYRIGAGEIETTLLDHPAVAEAAVVGLDDHDLGQRIVAWVVRREGVDTDADTLIGYVAGQLSSHKRPREIRFVGELPRNAMGKVVKSRLTEDAG
jgi:malonyl-CoA/methylmalonyl-CoA synthetase